MITLEQLAERVGGTVRGERREPIAGLATILEVLFPMPFVKDQRSLRTSVFWDVGNVFDTNCAAAAEAKGNCSDIDFGDMASSVGVGLTWITALGPLSFSLAMPVVKPENSDPQVFQFSLGQTF